MPVSRPRHRSAAGSVGFVVRAGSLLGAAVLLSSARAAHACAMCFGGQDSDWTAGFLLGTVLMVSLPPAIIVSAGVALYRATKRQEARQRSADEARLQVSPGEAPLQPKLRSV